MIYGMGAISSVGRAPRLHRGCRQFEPVIAYHPLQPQSSAGFGFGFSRCDLKNFLKNGLKDGLLQLCCRIESANDTHGVFCNRSTARRLKLV